MDRAFLDIFLKSGPARKYDVRHFTINNARNPKEQQQLLFKTSFLNVSILFKTVIIDDHNFINENKPVMTLVYFPYDLLRPEEGGESIIFSPENFLKCYRYKHKNKDTNHAAYEHDLEFLNILDSIPTFSPLIIELAFERQNISVPKSYLDLTNELRAKLKAQLKSRIRPLIVAAYGGTTTNVEKAVEDLTSKLFSLRNVNEVLPLVEALQLPVEQAVEFLASWIGITYYEYEYSNIQANLIEFSGWLSKCLGCSDNLSIVDKQQIKINVNFISSKLKKDWTKIYSLSSEYRDVYNDLIYRSNIPAFRSFLIKCKKSYWDLGDLLGRFEQTTIAWNTFKSSLSSGVVPAAKLIDFLMLLRNLHTESPGISDDASPKPIEGGFPNIVADVF